MEQFEKIIGFVVVVVTQMSGSSEKQRNICLGLLAAILAVYVMEHWVMTRKVIIFGISLNFTKLLCFYLLLCILKPEWLSWYRFVIACIIATAYTFSDELKTKFTWCCEKEEEPANFTLMAIPSSSSSDNEVQFCSPASTKAYKQLHAQYDSQTIEFRKSRLDVVPYKAALESVESRLVVYNVVPPPITGNFMPPKPNLVFHTAPIAIQTDHSAFTVQLSPAKPTTALQIVHSSVQSTKQVTPPRHYVQPVEAPIPAATPKPTSLKTSSSGKRKNKKTCLVCRSMDHLIKDCNFHAKPKSQPTPRNNAHMGYNKQHASFTKKFPQKHIVPASMLPKSKPVSVTTVSPICADVPKIMKTRPRHAHSLNTRSNLTIRMHKTCSHSSNTSNSSPKVTVSKAPMVSTAMGEESVIRDPEEESSEKTPTETKSKDKGKDILVEEPKPIKKKQQVKMDEDHEPIKGDHRITHFFPRHSPHTSPQYSPFNFSWEPSSRWTPETMSWSTPGLLWEIHNDDDGFPGLLHEYWAAGNTMEVDHVEEELIPV
nr:hypothetical protein [Tanacetum cinerariifolium]